jgi:hypothetical protein
VNYRQAKRKKEIRMVPSKQSARVAGVLFLIMVVAGMFAEVFFRQALFVSDASVTAGNILRNGFLFRAGMLSDIVMSLAYLFTALALYRLFVSVNQNMAKLMVLFAACGTVLLLSNLLNEFAPLYILGEGSPSGALNPKQLQDMAMISFVTYGHGYMIGQVFFSLWVLPLGFLIHRSNFIPKVFGILFIIETACGLLSVAAHFLLADTTLETALLMPGTVAEITFLLWLLIRGVSQIKLPAEQT